MSRWGDFVRTSTSWGRRRALKEDSMEQVERPRIRGWLMGCAIVLILACVLHSTALLVASKPDTPEQARLFDMMAHTKMLLPGAPDRTMEQLWFGFNWFLS